MPFIVIIAWVVLTIIALALLATIGRIVIVCAMEEPIVIAVIVIFGLGAWALHTVITYDPAPTTPSCLVGVEFTVPSMRQPMQSN